MSPINTYPKLSRLLSAVVAIILIALPFHALFTTWVGSNTGHLDLIKIWKEIILLAMLPLFGALVWRSQDLQHRLFGSRIIRLVVVYAVLNFALGIWALIHHQVNAMALIYALIINLRFLYFFVICLILASSSSLLSDNWRKVLLIPAAAVVLFGLVQQFALPYDFLRHFGYSNQTIPAYQTVDSNLDYTRIQSTLRGANPLGAYLVLVLPAAAVVLFKRKVLWMVSLLAGGVVMYYSYSRSAWIGLLLAFAILIYITDKFVSRKVMLIAAAIVVLIAAGLYTVRSSQTAQDALLHTSNSSKVPVSSNSARLTALKAGVHDVAHQPLGRGPGTAGPASFRNNHPPRIAEDYYLQLGQEIGILGMLLFVGINVVIGYKLWLERQNVLGRILLASLVGLSFVNLLSHAWTDDTLAYLWWGLAGIVCAPAILGNRHKHRGEKIQPTS